MNVTIEKMKMEHLAEVLEIEKSSFPNPWSWQSFRYEVQENAKALYLVAVHENKVIGYIGNWFVLNEGHITNLAVHPCYRGKGMGKKLIVTLLKIGARENIASYTLEVRVSNIVAQRLYRRLGFQEAGIRKNYYQNNQEDALIMWKHLSPDEMSFYTRAGRERELR